jgi:uncharacterized protein DUF4012
MTAGEGGTLAERVLLVSSDPFLGASLQGMARGRLLVASVDPAHRPTAWPGAARCTVVLDLGAKERAVAYPWVRQHHGGRLVVLLQPGEREASLPADPDRLVLRRPFRLPDLVEILVGTLPTAAPGDPSSADRVSGSSSRRQPSRSDPLQGKAEQRRRKPGSLSIPADPTSTSPAGAPAAPPAAPARPRDAGVASMDAQAASPGVLAAVKEGARRAAGWEEAAAKMEAARQAAADRRAARAARAAGRAAGVSTRPGGPGSPRSRRPVAPGRPGVGPVSRARGRRRSVLLGVLGGVVVVAVAAGGWLGTGLLEAREDLGVGAAGFRTQLTKAEAALRAGDPDAAKAAIQAADRDLDAAQAVTGRRPMRVAARLPVLSGAVSDATHLLGAARNLTRAGERAVAVSTHLQSGRFAVLEAGRFDLGALEDAIGQAQGLVAELDQVRAQLAQVRGGLFAPGSEQTKRWAVERLDAAVARARPVATTLSALPAALGAQQPRSYLVVLTSPAELRPGGGVPLAVVEVVLDKGRVEVRTRDGAITENVHNAQATWTAVPGDPWAAGGRFTTFSRANSSPNFPTAAQELLRGYVARGRAAPDGVLAIDPLAMRALLKATGPVTVPGYGQLTAANCVAATTHDAYLRWPNPTLRRRYNEALLQTLLGRLLSGRDLVTTGKVLGASGARRQLQIYATDPALQQVLGGNGMAGALSPAGQDYLAVHTLNTNRSRMDYFQRRAIHQLIQLRSDGSAQVTRTVQVANRVPPGEPIQDGLAAGYASGRAAAVLATYLPPGAKLEQVTLDGRPVRPLVAAEGDRPLLRVPLGLAPGQSASLTVRYQTPKAPTSGQGFGYRLTADPQVLVHQPSLRIDVVAPPGMRITAPPGWALDGATATRNQPFTDPIDTTLDLHS